MRICPICEARMAEAKCPSHDVQTVDEGVWARQSRLQLGAMVGERYRIERALGDGGYGVVYLATEVATGEQVALKVLRQEMEADGRAIKRFYREAKAASSLDHPNIVRIFDFGVDEKLLATYLVMEYVEGRTLQALMRQEGPMSEQRAGALLLQVARSLIEAHAREIVHRDLKPANIMVGADEQVKVLDFGIAKILGDDSTKSITGTGGTLGTPAYMSPEQVNAADVDFRSDLYSLGCLFHELLTGAPPYESERALAVMYQQVNDPPPPLPKILPGGDPPSATAIALHSALLAKDRAERPESTEVVVEAFAAVAEGRSASFETKATLAPGEHHLMTGEPRSPSKLFRNFGIFGLSAGLAMIVMVVWPNSSEPVAPQRESEELAKPSTVHLTLDSEPLGALISIDGRLEGATPRRLEVPADGASKTIVFEKAGYLAVEQRVVTDTSHSIRVVLEPSPKKEPPRAKPQRKLKTTR